MAHKEQFEFIEKVRAAFPEKFTGQKVLEVGSLDINGSVRTFFSGCDYCGIDVADGPGVDLVCEGQTFDAPDGSFGVVISCEAMEHNPHWRETLANMIRLTAPGGLVLMTCATVGRPEHGTARSEPTSSPLTVAKGWTYYRNLTRADLLAGVDLTPLAAWMTASNWGSYDLYFLGVKPPVESDPAPALERISREYRRRLWTTPRWLRHAAVKRLRYHLFGVR